MSVNRELPHILVLPEDDANRQIAIGFQLGLDLLRQRGMQVLKPAGGWMKVIETFESDHIAGMDLYSKRLLLLVIDFDGEPGRLAFVKNRIPRHLLDRVFVLGTLSQPEKLKAAGLGAYEEIGAKIANGCRDEGNPVWRHELLLHNTGELDRLSPRLRAILF